MDCCQVLGRLLGALYGKVGLKPRREREALLKLLYRVSVVCHCHCTVGAASG